jgi:4-amino-4-deoxy-L-arabinose transferase-like glycosyltransferase
MQNSALDTFLSKVFPWLMSMLVLLNAAGLLLPHITQDGAFYATIAKTMVLKSDYVNLYANGADWLDKPHFPFWIISLSYRVFGFNTFAYKLPAFLFWIMGAFYLFLFAKLLYNRSVAQIAVLIYMTAQHLVASNIDVRAEPYLTGLLIGSVYHFYKASVPNSAFVRKIFKHILIGSLLSGCAVMTKGVFVLIPITAGFATHWILKQEFNQFFRIRWWIAVVLLFVFILPELVCLYLQFDSQPEKIVFGKTGISAIRFFFWDSQFGRFFSSGPVIRKGGDLFFFLHTLLWAFAPWAILLYLAIIRNFKDIIAIAGKRRSAQVVFPSEFINFGAALIPLLVFSLSRFQLPHYTNILFPFFSVLTARYLYGLTDAKTIYRISIAQHVVVCLMVLFTAAFIWIFRPPYTLMAVLWTVLIFCLGWAVFRHGGVMTVIARSFAASVLLNGFLIGFIFPALVQYQSGRLAAQHMNQYVSQFRDHNVDPYPASKVQIGEFCIRSNFFEFYLKHPLHTLNSTNVTHFLSSKGRKPKVLFLPLSCISGLQKQNVAVEIIKSFHDFGLDHVPFKFIDHTTRSQMTQKMVLVKVKPLNAQ